MGQLKGFPILGSRGATVDWQLVQDHGKQANANHYQTVEKLASRGGLSWSELHAVLHDRQWQKVDEATAIAECRAIEARYLSARSPSRWNEAIEAAAGVAKQYGLPGMNIATEILTLKEPSDAE